MNDIKNLMEELFKIIYFNDLDQLIEFKLQHPEAYAQKDQFILDEEHGVTFDLVDLTHLNHSLWFSDEWAPIFDITVRKIRKKVDKMIKFWQDELGEDITQRHIQYNDYCNYFTCEEPLFYEDGIDWMDFSDYLDNGYRKIDLQLNECIECLNFDEVERLLQEGANPTVNLNLEEDDDDTAINRTAAEMTYLATFHSLPLFVMYDRKGSKIEESKLDLFSYLMGGAAYTKMYSLLKKWTESDRKENH